MTFEQTPIFENTGGYVDNRWLSTLTIPILNFSEHSCVFPADSP